MPGRTWIIAPDVETLERRWKALISQKDPFKLEELFHPHETGDKAPTKPAKVGLTGHEHRSYSVASDKGDAITPTQYAFRSFDEQWIIPDNRLINRPNPKLWSTYSSQQIFLTALDRSSPRSGPSITLTECVPDHDHYNGSFAGRAYPLWADAKGSKPNIRSELLELLSQTFGLTVSPEDAFAYIAAIMAHPAFTSRFAKDLKQPGLRLPLTAAAVLFAEAVGLGREVIWLHCYGERYVDPASGRPKGPPRLPANLAPRIPAGGAIPPAPEPLPNDMTYEAEKRRLHVGKGYVDKVSPEMWNYEISGKQVVWHWFSYRRLDRSKPQIGDRRPPSPLDKIQPEGWLHEYTTDLLDLLNVLGRLVALEPAQADLLVRICDGPLVEPAKLQQAGLWDSAAGESAGDSY